MGRRPPSLAESLWSRVDRSAGPDSCWLWLGPRNSDGYGMLFHGYARLRAHRVAYELTMGPVPDGLVLDHVRARGCEHRHCVNPAHLEPVTQRENLLRGRGWPAINAQKTHCKHGHEFTPANTYWRERGRDCRSCHRDQESRARQARTP